MNGEGVRRVPNRSHAARCRPVHLYLSLCDLRMLADPDYNLPASYASYVHPARLRQLAGP